MDSHTSATAEQSERPVKYRKLSRPEDEQFAELQRQAGSMNLASSYAAPHGLPTMDVIGDDALLSPHRPHHQPLYSGLPNPITLHERFTADYPSTLPSPSSEASSPSNPGLPFPIAEQMQSSSTSQQGDHRMTGQSSPARDLDGAEQLFPAHGGMHATAETAANTAAPMIRGAGSKQHGSLRDPSSSSAGPGGAKHVHQPSGYEWEKDEDAPGYLWKNKKAREEHARAMEQIIEKDKMIGSKSNPLHDDSVAIGGNTPCRVYQAL